MIAENTNSYTIEKFLKQEYAQFISNLSTRFLKDHNEEAGTQKDAWDFEYHHLKDQLQKLKKKSGRVIFEYRISGFKKVIDVVLLYSGKIFVLEYKCGAHEYSAADIKQTNGYALRLKYFHSKSNDNWIIPILVATDAPAKELCIEKMEEDNVCNPILCNSENLCYAIEAVDREIPYDGDNDWENEWEKGIYKASPTILEAARDVWKKNNVSGFQSDGEDSKGTIQRLQAEDYIVKTVVPETIERNGKSICFVTGVPGAGKTLVGLNISVALNKMGASLLSGNGPLVSVLSTALKRDLKENKKNLNNAKNEISVESIIRGAYEYKKEIFGRLLFNTEDGTITKVGSEHSTQHVIIFDEAQRAWTQAKLIKPGQAGKKYWQEKNFPFSEPALLLWDMNNIPDWGVFVCLVGGGQEIHDGEAGICEWLSALKKEEFKDWHIYMADAFQGDEYDSKDDSGETVMSYRELFALQNRLHKNDSLHLTECQRSIRSSKVSDLINSILNCEREKAQILFQEVKDKFHIHITRDVDKAKQKLRDRKAELDLYDDRDCRIGMLMSSSAARLRPLGYPMGIKAKVDHWFLDDEENVNSSNFLEVALDEFSVQGLELDITAVMWDADMRYNKNSNSWSFHNFNNGKDWSEIVDDPGPKTKKESDAKRAERERKNRVRQINRSYMLNAYRVLLTRGRTDMVIVVPKGDNSDPSRKEAYYDETYEYLKSIGIQEL